MTFQIQQVQGEYKIVLTAEQMEALHLAAGAEVDLIPHTNGKFGNEKADHGYISVEKGLAAFREVEPAYRETFLELAK